MTVPLGAATIVAALEDAAATAGDRSFHYHLEDGRTSVTYEEMLAQARLGAGALAGLGVQPGDPVGVLGPNRPEWVRWALSAWARGATVVPVPMELRLVDPVAYVARIRGLIEAAGCRVVLADPRVAPALGEMAIPWDLMPDPGDDAAVVQPSPEDVAVLQFTSGTTSAPKMATLTHGAVMACCFGFLTTWNVDQNDVPLSWLPLFHDNGLFGHLVCAVAARLDNHLIPTERFARAPALWFRLATELGATLTSGPGSAWAVALKSALKKPDGIDLSTLRMGVMSAEAIDPALLDRLDASAAAIGLRPGTISGAYGLAEATVVVTIARPGEGTRIDEVDLDELTRNRRAVPAAADAKRTRRVASCGRPMAATRVRIAGPDGELPDRHVGDIHVGGPTLMNGYAGRDDSEQPFTEDGWLVTGDVGYMAEGELFFTGREKDLVISLGRNYSPEDLEWEAERVPGVRPGRSVAFNAEAEGEGGVVVVFEVSPEVDPEATAADVRRAISRSLGIAIEDAVPTFRGTIPKTTSGKSRRAVLREAYARGEVSRVGPGGVGGGE